MTIASVLSRLTRASARAPRRADRSRLAARRRSLFALEQCEDRTLLSTMTWGGGVGAWSVASNWAGNQVPGANDTAIINGGSVAVDANASINIVTLSGGAVSIDSGATLTIRKDLTVASGATLGGDGGVTFGGADHSVATIDGTVDFGGDLSFDKAITSPGANFKLQGLTGALTVGGDVNITGANQINGGQINVGGDVSTSDDTVSGTTVLYLNGAKTISGDGSLPTVEVAGGVTTVSDAPHMDYLTVSGGALNASSLGILHNLTVSDGAFNVSALTFDGTDHGKATLSGGTINVGGLTFDKSVISANFTLSGTLPISGDLTVTGAQNIDGGQINVGGNITTTDSTVSGATVIYLNHNATINSSGGALPAVLVSAGATTVTGDLQVSNLTVTGGSFKAPTGTLGIKNNLTRTGSGVFNANGGTISFNQSGHSTINIGATSLNNVIVDKTVGSTDLNVTGTSLKIGGNLTIKEIGKIFGTVNVAGDVTTSDTTVGGSGTIVMVGYAYGTGVPPQTLTATVDGAQVPNLKISQYSTYYSKMAVGSDHPVTVNGDLTITSTFVMDGGTINVVKNVVTTDTGVGGTATIKLDGNHTINAGGQSGQLPNLLVTGGAANAANAPSLGVQSLTIESSGTFKAPPSLRIARDLTVDGSYVHNNGSVNFATNTSSTGVVAIADPGANPLYDATLELGGYSRLNVSGQMNVARDLTVATVNNNDPQLNGGDVVVGGNVVTTSNLGGTATIVFNSGAHAINAGGQSGWLPSIKVTGGSVDASGAGILTARRDLTVSGGTFKAPANTLAIGRNTTITAPGVFNPNGGTVQFTNDSVNDGTVSLGATQLNNATFTMSNYGDLTVQGDLIVNGLFLMQAHSGSTLAFSGPNVHARGNFQFDTGTFSQGGTGLLLLDPTTGFRSNINRSVVINGAMSIQNIQFGGKGDGGPGSQVTNTISGSGAMSVTKSLTIAKSAGTSSLAVVLNGGQINATGSGVVVTAGDGAAGGSTNIRMTGGKANGDETNRLPALTVAGNVTTDSANLALTSFTLQSGSFKAPSGNMRVSGDFTRSGGTFNANNGTLYFDATPGFRSATTRNINVGGALTLNNLRFSGNSNGGSGSQINYTIANGDTLNVNGALTVQKETGTGDLNIVLNGGTIAATNVTAGAGAAGGTTTIAMASGTVTGSATNRLPALAINGAVTTSSTDLAVTDFTINNGGAFTAPSGELRVSGNFTVNSGGSYAHNNGTLYFDATSPFRASTTRYIKVAGPLALYNLRYGGYGYGGSGSAVRYNLDGILNVANDFTVEKSGVASSLDIYADGGTINVSGTKNTLGLKGGSTTIN